MRRNLPLALLLIALLGAFMMSLAAPTFADNPPVRGLGNTIRRLKAGQPVVVGYFGGSITEGAGASKAAETSWRARTTAYLRESNPGVTITEVNASIGGTGSDLGAFRCQRDLLDKNPDLVFVEFAVNDGGAAEERTLRAMEGIVRQIWRANPRTDIVFVYTATKGFGDQYAKGETPASVLRHQRIADYYGIPTVNVGKVLAEKATKEYGGDWKPISADNVHPNDTGYAVYAEVVRAFLEAHRNDKEIDPVSLPAPLTAHPLENGRLIDAWSLPTTPGWTKEEQNLSGRYPHRLAATGPTPPDGELVLRFTGDAVGLYWLIAPDSGDIEYQIDGGEWKQRSSWDQYALRFTRANYTLLADDLPPGPHELRIRVLGEKQAQSTGTAVRIGAFLVNGQ